MACSPHEDQRPGLCIVPHGIVRRECMCCDGARTLRREISVLSRWWEPRPQGPRGGAVVRDAL